MHLLLLSYYHYYVILLLCITIGYHHYHTLLLLSLYLFMRPCIAGILDAGGRNGIVSLCARSGYFRRTTMVGLAMFTQYWYWYPLSYFLSMSLQASAFVGVNASLQLPRYELRCDCKPSQFAYRQAAPQAASAQVAKMPTAVLSTTARAKEKVGKW